jgi:threonine dehydratase
MTAPCARDVRHAAERISATVHRTPVMTSRSFNREAGVRVFFKCENLQLGGAFKIRGAANFVGSLTPEELKRGVVAYSSGNHAQAVAIAARKAGTKATVVMPLDAPQSKLEATEANAATIVRYDRLRENREEIARRIAEETGAITIPPYDHPWTIAGQGTAALELLEDIPDLDAMIAPIGGGGLMSGCALIAHEIKPSIRLFGAEPEEARDTWLSLQKGERVEIPTPATIADGLRATSPGAITFPILKKHLEGVLLVTEEEIKFAIRFLLTRMKILVEPSGAVPAAALLARKLPAGIRSIGVILSGGNVDFELLASL